jgi:hypothetical protein
MGVFVAVGKDGIGEGASVAVAASAGAHEARIKIRSMVINIFFMASLSLLRHCEGALPEAIFHVVGDRFVGKSILLAMTE